MPSFWVICTATVLMERISAVRTVTKPLKLLYSFLGTHSGWL